MSSSDLLLKPAAQWAIVLTCIAHFFSHFYMLLLPPLLPVLSMDMQLSYTQLGFGITLFSLMTGLAQAPMGILVDRLGAGWVLIVGLALESLAFGLIGVWPFHVAFLFCMSLAGLANAVYHPADYAILNAVALPKRMGQAFSFHTAAGHLGEAVAPLSVLLLASFLGWQTALMICGLLGFAAALVLYFQRDCFQPRTMLSPSATETAMADSVPSVSRRQLLLSRPILMSVVFFVGLTLVGRGVTGFGVTALHEEHAFSLPLAGTLISAWLFASPLGVLAGGRIADRKSDFQATIVGCLLFIAAGIALLAWLSPGVWLSGSLFALCGFASGLIAPSRDMLVRSLTPRGQAGTVFGFVSTGFNVGGVIAPLLFGFLLDQGAANGVFWIVALASLLTVLTVVGTAAGPRKNVAKMPAS